ncbi:MAG: hypothetical protein OEQ29_14090 [Alphaproteobacteria bacterium]|nr:hypothetical protein [Alphaproteobacteria bacterium]
MVRIVFATLMLAILSTLPSVGNAVENGTRVIVSDHSYWALIARLEAAIKRHKLRIISRASVRGAERQRKLGIPGNMVIGAFRDEYTARILRANVAAGIEAPIRFYITRGENEKTTTLWYRRPSWVLAPYGDESGDLRALATELDTVMETIVTEATKRPDRNKHLLVKRNTGNRKAVKPAAREPAPRKPERVVTSTPGKPARTAKAKPAITTSATKKKGALARSETAKTVAVTKTESAVPTPLAPKAPVASAAPKRLTGATPKPPAGAASKLRAAAGPKLRASAAPKPLTRPDAAAPRPIEAAPPQRAKAAAPEQTSRRPAAKTPVTPATKAKPERVTENKSIELSPLMLRLQGQ